MGHFVKQNLIVVYIQHIMLHSLQDKTHEKACTFPANI